MRILQASCRECLPSTFPWRQDYWSNPAIHCRCSTVAMSVLPKALPSADTENEWLVTRTRTRELAGQDASAIEFRSEFLSLSPWMSNRREVTEPSTCSGSAKLADQQLAAPLSNKPGFREKPDYFVRFKIGDVCADFLGAVADENLPRRRIFFRRLFLPETRAPITSFARVERELARTG